MTRRARRVLTVCLSITVAVACAAAAVIQTLHLKDLRQQLDAMAEQLDQQKQQLAQTQKQLEEAQAARAALEAEQASALSRSEQLTRAAEAMAGIADGDEIGRVRVEGTEVDCPMYWGDTGSQFAHGAGVHAADGCVLPGENGTVFVGGHTDSWFVDLKSAEIGAVIRLETPWGAFSYRITETKVIGETEIDQCRWGAEEPSCILYTCYPFGIQTPTTQRYLVYADPIETDADGVIPDEVRDAAAPADG